jgi:hypothetical protein
VKEGKFLCIASIFSRLAAQLENTISVTIDSTFHIPIPVEGNLVRADWLCSYTSEERPKKFSFVLQSWDTASKSGELNDYSGRAFLEDGARRRVQLSPGRCANAPSATGDPVLREHGRWRTTRSCFRIQNEGRVLSVDRKTRHSGSPHRPAEELCRIREKLRRVPFRRSIKCLSQLLQSELALSPRSSTPIRPSKRCNSSVTKDDICFLGADCIRPPERHVLPRFTT